MRPRSSSSVNTAAKETNTTSFWAAVFAIHKGCQVTPAIQRKKEKNKTNTSYLRHLKMTIKSMLRFTLLKYSKKILLYSRNNLTFLCPTWQTVPSFLPVRSSLLVRCSAAGLSAGGMIARKPPKVRKKAKQFKVAFHILQETKEFLHIYLF